MRKGGRPMKNTLTGATAALAFMAAIAGSARAQDAEAGKKIFRKCASCHQIGEGAKNRTGPVLTGIIGRPAGSWPGFKYSKGMQALAEKGHVWSEDEIFAWLFNPTRYLRKKTGDPRARAKMKYMLRDEQARRDVIAYLATFEGADQTGAETAPEGASSESTPTESTAPETTAQQSPAPNTAPTVKLPADPQGICVANGSPDTLVFTAETSDGSRMIDKLKPGQWFCISSEGDGTVGAFLSEDALEGCERLARKDQPEILLQYHDFDRCLWQGNSN